MPLGADMTASEALRSSFVISSQVSGSLGGKHPFGNGYISISGNQGYENNLTSNACVPEQHCCQNQKLLSAPTWRLQLCIAEQPEAPVSQWRAEHCHHHSPQVSRGGKESQEPVSGRAP
ncbi:UNVERIFIED_CONTAM: hypothetical protein FKN15_054188 [Acipenser sinensis]